jgi:hypothetical protein
MGLRLFESFVLVLFLRGIGFMSFIVGSRENSSIFSMFDIDTVLLLIVFFLIFYNLDLRIESSKKVTTPKTRKLDKKQRTESKARADIISSFHS